MGYQRRDRDFEGRGRGFRRSSKEHRGECPEQTERETFQQAAQSDC